MKVMIGIDTLRAAAVTAAAGLSARPNMDAPFLESSLRDGLVRALGGSGERRIRIEGWSPRLGGVDVYVPGVALPDVAPERATGIETKVWNVDQVLYDLFKLAAMCQQGELGIGYVVVAARKQDWVADQTRGGAISRMCSEEVPLTSSTTIPMTEEGEHWHRMVTKANVKPAWIPARISTETIAPVDVPAAPDHEIRILSVHHVGDERLHLDERGNATELLAQSRA